MLKPVAFVTAAFMSCLGAVAEAALTPSALYLDVPVSDVGTDNTLATSNTSRKLAVAADGTIYALFRSPTNGIRVARSTNRGQSFTASVQVSAVNAEAELGIASDGDLHVTWVTGGNIFHVVSSDGATTFSAPVTVGAGASSAHMALDGDRVYIIPRNGSVVYHSADDGATFASTVTGATYAFADIFVDPLTRDVLVIVDSPAVSFYKSTNFAQSFVGPTATGKAVTYSVGALASTDTNRYLFIAGSGTNLERVEVDTPAYFTATVAPTAGSTTRSLSADVFGNVVSGYLVAGTNDLKFEHSNDLGVTLGTPVTVASGAARANAAINTINGDVLFLYESSGHQIFLSTYARALINYDITVSPSALNFGNVELNGQASLPIQLSNVSPGPVAVSSISASADFSVSHDCGTTLASSASCTATVTFSPSALGSASGSLTLTLGGATRHVPLSGVAIPPRPSTTTQLNASASTVEVGGSVTLNAEVTGTAPTGSVTFSDGGAALADCSSVPLTGTSAACTITSLTGGEKQYTAAYSGDAANAPSTSAPVAVTVGIFQVTPIVTTGGALSSGSVQTVIYGNRATLTFAPNSGYQLASVTGCGGTRDGNTYTTGPVTADCAVTATFTLANQEVEVIAKSEGGGGAMAWPMLLIGALGVFARRRLLPLAAALVVFGQAQAEESQWFVGGALGQARGDQGNSDVAADLARRGFSADAVHVGDTNRTAYRLFAGYRITPNWIVEGGYTDLGDVSTSASASVPVGQAEAYARALLESLPVSASGYEASVAFRYPFNEAFAVAARVGAWRWENEQRATFGGQRLKASPDGTDALFGVSLEWNFVRQWVIGVEATRYRADDEDLDMLAGSVKFRW